ncbi:MAG TPA: endonuclease domain-containing protein [Tepidisphaeraceae bacterium]|nr:endonuclease domain-containing protein [Tepidisphaeraceae bacterium]
MRRSDDPLLHYRAHKMRRAPSDAERRLWSRLRDRRLGGFKFRRQVPVDEYIADFYCEHGSLVVEVDGDQHAEPEAVAYDERRTARLAELRLRVLRFSARQVMRETDAVANMVLRFLTEGY